MSKQVEERVVSMQFDNAQFERNVQTSMGTIDKLKQKLNFNGATKGLENINATAKKVNMSGISGAVETVQAKFSALEVMGVTALANITNSAVNAGKRIVSALTIDPITTGFSEYELKMNSVRTIMASTGEDIETVNKYLEELNTYSDQTIYSFSDMTQNIGKFTNAGVKLEDAVMAIQGISNEAALSGANANEASRAMYNFAQALSAGYVKLIDWKSIENANMATVEFKDQLIQTAVEMGTLVKVGDQYQSTTKDLNGKVSDFFTTTTNFNDSLSAQWMTTDVLVKTLSNYADETTEIGAKAFEAATKVTTLTQMFDVMKETAQSGWAKTWELIFGDFEEAKDFFSSVTESFSTFIDGMSDGRNNILEEVLNSKWDSFIKEINNAGIATEDFNNKLKETAKEQGISVDKLIEEHGTFANVIAKGLIPTEAYVETLEKFDAKTEEAAASLTRANEYVVVKGDNLTKIARRYGTTWKELYKLNQDIINDPNLIYPDQVLKLTDAQLENMGYTKEQINVLRDLAKEAKETGTPMNELVTAMGKPSGRQLLFDTLKNTMSAVLGVMNEIGGAWSDIFPPENLVSGLTKLIENLHAFSEGLVLNEDKADKLRRTFKGLFAILDIIGTIVGGPIKLAFKIINKILGMFGYSMLDVTAHVGDALVAFRDWLDSLLDIEWVFDLIMPYLEIAGKWIKDMAIGVKDWVSSCEGIKRVGEYFSSALTGIKEWIAGIKEADNIPQYIIQGLANGIKNGASAVWDACVYLATSLVNKIKDILGIESPSKVMMAIGGFIIAGLVSGIFDGIPLIGESLAGVKDKIIETIGKIDWGAIFSMGTIGGALLVSNKIADALKNFSAPFEGLGDVFSGVGDVLSEAAKGTKKVVNNFAKIEKSFSKVLKSVSFSIKAKAIRDLALSLLILVGAIAIITFLDPTKLLDAVFVVGVLAGILVLLAVAMEKMSSVSVDISKSGAKVSGLKKGLLGIAAALLLVALTVKIIGSMDPEEAFQGFFGLTAIVLAIGTLMLAILAVSKIKGDAAIVLIGKTILAIAEAMLLMAVVIKIVGGMDDEALFKGLIVVDHFALIIAGLIAATKLAGKDIDNIGSTILKISAAMILLALVLRITGGMDAASMGKGLAVITVFGLIIAGLIAVTKLAGKDINNIGSTILKLSAGMLLMALVLRLVGGMDTGDAIKGIAIITAFGGIITGLIAATKLAGGNLDKLGSTILQISLAIGVLALVATLLGFLKIEHLAKGITAVGILALIMGLMVKSLKGAQNVKGSIIAMTVAIGIMAAAVTALSFIDPSRLATASLGLGMVMGAFALMIKSAKGLKKIKGLLGTMAIMLGVVVVLGGAIYALSALKVESCLGAVFSLSLLLLAMTSAMVILSKAKGISNSSLGSLAIMGLVVAELAVILGAMSAFNVTASIETAFALGLLLNTMAAAMAILGVSGKVSNGAIGSLALMGLVVAELAVILGAMSAFNVTASIETAVSLSVLLLAMSAAMIPMATVCKMMSVIPFTAALKAAGVMILFVAALAAIVTGLGALSQIEGFDGLIADGAKVMGVLGEAIGNFLGGIIKGVANGIISILPDLGLSLSVFGIAVQPFVECMKRIDASVLEGAGCLAGAVVALTVADLISAVSWITGGFMDLGINLGLFMDAAQPFFDGLKQMTPEMTAAAGNLASLIMAITVADVIDGIKSLLGLEGGIDTFGKKLAGFGESMKEFLASIADLTNDDLTRVDIAAQAGSMMADMANKVPKEGGWAQKILGSTDMKKFSEGITAYGEALVAFSASVSTLKDADFDRITIATNAGTALSDLNNAIPKSGGWAQDILGSQDLKTWGESIVAFGGSLVNYANAISDITEDDASKISMSAEAGGALSELNGKIPKSGGWAQDIMGSQDLKTFGDGIVAFAKGLMDYIAVAKSIDASSVEAIKNSGSAVDELKKVAEKVPSSGGWWAGIAGSKDSGSFGESIKSLGIGIRTYIDSVKGITAENITQIKSSGDAITAIKETIKNVTTDNTNVNNASSFVTAMTSVANGILDYIDSSYGVSKEGIAAINETKTAGDAIVAVVNAIGGIDSTNVSSAIENIQSMVGVISEMTITNFTGADKFKAALDTLASADIAGFGETMKSLGETGLNKFVSAFTESSAKAAEAGETLISAITNGVTSGKETLGNAVQDIVTYVMTKASIFRTVGQLLMMSFKLGMSSQASTVKEAVASIITSCSTVSIADYQKFYNAGSYLVDGFAAGISDNTYKAEAKAAAMADAAYTAAQEELDVNSPSKVFRKLGTSVPEGFAMGIDKLGGMVERSSISMARSAISGTQDAISRIVDVINSDMDTQPTIRPVLDLSAVSSGAGAINGMLGIKPSVGVMSNVNSIGSMMNGRQNGTNSDVISAIRDLGKSLGSGSGDSYTINGITYDDGSNITDAVQTLIRAARVERRR